MGEEHRTIILNSKASQMNEELARLSDRDLAITIRDFIEEAIVENNVYYDLDDIAEAVNRLYPIISGIVFNSNFSHVRRDFRLFNKIITFLVKHLA